MEEITNWVDEFYILMNELLFDERESEIANVDRFINEIDKLIQNKKIQYRFTVMMLGIYCDDARQRVNSWLIYQNFEHLTHRNPSDALFLYMYEVFKDIPHYERLPKFFDYLKEYLEWTKNRTTPSPVSSAKNLHSDIITFGQLAETVKLNSVVIEDNDIMETVAETGKRAMDKLSALIKNGNSLTDFLNYLHQDVATQAYNQRATYYVQKMLYNIMKFSIDMIFEHNLPQDPKTAEAYINAKNVALRDNSTSSEVFNRFVNYNRLFLKSNDKKDLRQWLYNNMDKEIFNINECLKWLSDKEISYQSLFTDMFSFFMGEKYGYVIYQIKSEGNQAGYRAVNLSEEAYTGIFGKNIKDIRTRMKRILCDIISGNVYVSRTFLILFGLYAGDDEARLNHVLSRNDFARLSRQNSFDNVILTQLDENVTKQLRDTINTKAFIDRKRPYTDNRDTIMEVGAMEREQYNDIIMEFSSVLGEFLNSADNGFLTSIFEGEKMKRLLEKSENELKRMK